MLIYKLRNLLFICISVVASLQQRLTYFPVASLPTWVYKYTYIYVYSYAYMYINKMRNLFVICMYVVGSLQQRLTYCPVASLHTVYIYSQVFNSI